MWCAVLRRYNVPYNGGLVFCDSGVLLCEGTGYSIIRVSVL